jgi:hypothetical protein
MRHLTAEQLVDIAEGTTPETAVAHLQTCESCRGQLAELRAVISAAADVDVPEPSPLFWDHLSTRVRAAVAAEEAPRGVWWRPATWPRFAIPAAAGGLVVIAIAAAVTSRGLTPIAPPAETTPPARVIASTAVESSDDVALNLVGDLAAQMDWDAASEVGLPMHPGAVDQGMAELSAGERQEMRRLLQEALGRPGG